MILVLGYSTEATIGYLQEALAARGKAFDLLDLSRLRDAKKLRLSGNASDLIVQVDDTEYDFGKYSAFYCRQYHAELGEPMRNQALDNVLGWMASYLEDVPAIVVNRPSAGMLNSRKLDQLRELKRCGFQVPHTVVTGSAEEARALVNASGRWASKSCSAAKTRAVVVDEDVLRRLPYIDVAPTTFQAVAPGYDVRVHVIGEHVIPLKIVSKQFDYRFRGDEANEFSGEVDIPPAVLVACRRYCKDERLVFAGFDFKVHEGRWVVLEANPMPGFDYFDRQKVLAGRIAGALCEVLGGRPVAPPVASNRTPLVGADRRPVLSPFPQG